MIAVPLFPNKVYADYKASEYMKGELNGDIKQYILNLPEWKSGDYDFFAYILKYSIWEKQLCVAFFPKGSSVFINMVAFGTDLYVYFAPSGLYTRYVLDCSNLPNITTRSMQENYEFKDFGDIGMDYIYIDGKPSASFYSSTNVYADGKLFYKAPVVFSATSSVNFFDTIKEVLGMVPNLLLILIAVISLAFGLKLIKQVIENT